MVEAVSSPSLMSSAGNARRSRCSGPGGDENFETGGHTDSRDGGDDLSELKLVKNGSFTSSIQSDHKDS